MRLQPRFAFVALVSLISIPVFGLPAGGVDRERREGPPEVESPGAELDPLISSREVLINDQIDSSEQLPLGSIATCSYGERLTANPTASGNRVVFVYILTSGGASDDHLDQPRVCTDGSILRPPLEFMYRDTAIWMAKKLTGTTFGSRRWTPVAHTYRNPYTGSTASLYASFFYNSSDRKSVV